MFTDNIIILFNTMTITINKFEFHSVKPCQEYFKCKIAQGNNAPMFTKNVRLKIKTYISRLKYQ